MLPCPICEKPLDETRIRFQCGHEYHAPCGVKLTIYGSRNCRICGNLMTLEPKHVKQYLGKRPLPEIIAEANKHVEAGTFYERLASLASKMDPPSTMSKERAWQEFFISLGVTCFAIFFIVVFAVLQAEAHGPEPVYIIFLAFFIVAFFIGAFFLWLSVSVLLRWRNYEQRKEKEEEEVELLTKDV